MHHSVGLATVLNPVIGYHAAAEVALEAQRGGRSIRDVVVEKGLMSGGEFDALVERAAGVEEE